MKVNFSKNGNLVYQAYIGYEDDGYWLKMADCSFAAEMPTKQGLIEEANYLLHTIMIENLKDKYTYLPKTNLKPEKGSEIIEFELDKELSDMVMDFVEAGGKVINA